MAKVEMTKQDEWMATTPITNAMLNASRASQVSVEDIRKACDQALRMFRPACPFNFLTQHDLWFEWHKRVHFDKQSRTVATLEIQSRELMLASMEASMKLHMEREWEKEREDRSRDIKFRVMYDPLPICSNKGAFIRNSV